MKISFIIITWNSEEYIEKCIYSYAQSVVLDGFTAEFLIVDNGSADNTVKLLKDAVLPALPAGCKTEIFEFKRNLGTTKSRNFALKRATGEYVVICDSDTEFLDGNWHSVTDYLSKNEKVGIIAPHLFYENGNSQNSVKLFPTFFDKLLKLRKIFFKFFESGKDFYPGFPWVTIRSVDTAISAFWIFKRELLSTVGYLDENIFYSPEDIDFCLRVWKSGKSIVFYPDFKITHNTQQLSHTKPFSYIAVSHFVGLLYYFKKHSYWFSRTKLYGKLNKPD
ncbi:MAG: glycosyltransferase [Spirochaetes bacterium]|nr:glycosyltransferase [Spirochaetota bacterium]